jgi:hypothetical protein
MLLGNQRGDAQNIAAALENNIQFIKLIAIACLECTKSERYFKLPSRRRISC